jgi:hypothetical protein
VLLAVGYLAPPRWLSEIAADRMTEVDAAMQLRHRVEDQRRTE